jgi:hypothetical protein
MNNAEAYAESILRDETEQLISEVPTVYETHKIERIYTFKDGAVVKYEWQSEESFSPEDKYNHRFTLIKLPAANPDNLQMGIIKVINYKGKR